MDTISGEEGKDWNFKVIRIRDDAAAKIAATNTTLPKNPANTSTIALKVNGEVVVYETKASAQVTATYVVAGTGAYKVEVECSNTHADAQSCEIAVELFPEITIECEESRNRTK